MRNDNTRSSNVAYYWAPKRTERPLVLFVFGVGVVLLSLSLSHHAFSLTLSLYTLSREHISFIHAHTPWLAIQPTAL